MSPLLPFLKELLSTPGLSGHEEGARLHARGGVAAQARVQTFIQSGGNKAGPVKLAKAALQAQHQGELPGADQVKQRSKFHRTKFYHPRTLQFAAYFRTANSTCAVTQPRLG